MTIPLVLIELLIDFCKALFFKLIKKFIFGSNGNSQSTYDNCSGKGDIDIKIKAEGNAKVVVIFTNHPSLKEYINRTS